MDKILFHKYKVLRLIGSGGMGRVWLAEDIHLNQPVVVKESREEFLTLEAAFLKELEHPGLPAVYDCFCQEERTYLVMEYIEGMSLRRYLGRHGKVSGEQAVQWAVELCGILGYLHGRHPAVIYRDLKPENIMIRQNGRLKLIDFGGAMYALCGDKKEMFCVGTKGYSPPEQWKDMRGDVTWDIYSLGAVLHEMLTGENPTLPAYRRGPVREYDRGLWSALNKIIDKCTALDAEKRYQSMEELKEDLTRRRFLPGMGFGAVKSFLPGTATLWLMGVCTAFLFTEPLLKGVPENEFPFPYLEKPLIFLMLTLLWYLVLYRRRNKKNYLRKREKNVWLSEKKFSGLFTIMLLLFGGVSPLIFSGSFVPAVHGQEKPEKLWVEMRDGMGRKMLLKYDAVYETGDSVRFELPACRLPAQKLAMRIVAVGEDGEQYSSRIFYVRGIEGNTESDTTENGTLLHY